MESVGCNKMRTVNNVKANLTECNMKIFPMPVPAYFCIEYCDRLVGCLAVTMERDEKTSWCCAFLNKSSNISVYHGNHILIHSVNVKFVWNRDNSFTGKNSIMRSNRVAMSMLNVYSLSSSLEEPK